MRMAIAERPDLTGQPLALVHADLSQLAGWRAQLDAAERLTRSGAIEPQQWFAIYTARVPSASGGVWDRVAAVQALDAALLAGDAAGVARRLPDAFGHMQRAGLTVAFSTIFAERLQRVPLTGDAGLLARRIGLLSPEYERIAQSAVAQTAASGRPSPSHAARRLRRATATACARPLPARFPTRGRNIATRGFSTMTGWARRSCARPSFSATGRGTPATSPTL
jgi:hypothetical protein